MVRGFRGSCRVLGAGHSAWIADFPVWDRSAWLNLSCVLGTLCGPGTFRMLRTCFLWRCLCGACPEPAGRAQSRPRLPGPGFAARARFCCPGPGFSARDAPRCLSPARRAGSLFLCSILPSTARHRLAVPDAGSGCLSRLQSKGSRPFKEEEAARQGRYPRTGGTVERGPAKILRTGSRRFHAEEQRQAGGKHAARSAPLAVCCGFSPRCVPVTIICPEKDGTSAKPGRILRCNHIDCADNEKVPRTTVEWL